MTTPLHQHDINIGEHAANDAPPIDWKAYYCNTPVLKLNKNQKKDGNRSNRKLATPRA